MDNIQGFHSSHYCGDLRLSDAGKTVSLCGWVQRQRDLGGLIFVDLRDRAGKTQCVFDPDVVDAEGFEARMLAEILPFSFSAGEHMG